MGANFNGADLADADMLMARLNGSNFENADMSGADLEAAVLASANLKLARLSGARLTDTDFTNSNWWRARGLSSAQASSLRENFAPSDNADEALRRDYAAWLRESGN